MKTNSSFRQGIAKVLRLGRNKQYDAALAEVQVMMKSWPRNPQLHTAWAKLVQLQDQPAHSLTEVKRALKEAVALDRNAPAAAIELGYFLNNVEDNPGAAAKAFAESTRAARRLLIDSLIGQARALLELNKKEEALKSVMESLYLANIDSAADGQKPLARGPDMIVRDSSGQMQVFQIKGPFAVKIEELLGELFPKRSA